MAILNNKLPRPESVHLGLPHRVYLWRGGIELDTLPAFDERGEPKLAPSAGQEEAIANPRFGAWWCFEYGELYRSKKRLISEVGAG